MPAAPPATEERARGRLGGLRRGLRWRRRRRAPRTKLPLHTSGTCDWTSSCTYTLTRATPWRCWGTSASRRRLAGAAAWRPRPGQGSAWAPPPPSCAAPAPPWACWVPPRRAWAPPRTRPTREPRAVPGVGWRWSTGSPAATGTVAEEATTASPLWCPSPPSVRLWPQPPGSTPSSPPPPLAAPPLDSALAAVAAVTAAVTVAVAAVTAAAVTAAVTAAATAVVILCCG
mmetsp:Transcript_27107/g.66475  ORF Transcript_27107/g.66475 Transcript_27107/m.66475 type:complete len:229 (-) Transcript_27107:288-974(-)